ELGLSGYAIYVLLHQSALLNGVLEGLELIRQASRDLLPVVLVGAPLLWQGHLFNGALAIHKGHILGIVPKTSLPNYREFYEARHFALGSLVPEGATLRVNGIDIPFGTDILLECEDLPDFVLGMEICEDLWVPNPPSSFASMAGASVIANLSASNAIVGKSDDRHALCRVQSSRCNVAYLYSAAGFGESTTDLAWDGQALVYENGKLLGQGKRFSTRPEVLIRDVDLELLAADRMRNGSLAQNRGADQSAKPYRRIAFKLAPPLKDIGLCRSVDRFPYVPGDLSKLDALCSDAFEIQSQGLARRMQAARLERLVVGISGGLDSAHALLVARHAMELLELPLENILAYTLPAFATSDTTKGNARRLMKSIGVTAEEIDVGPACQQMLEDIGHPAASGAPVYDVAYENVQAGARTSLLFRLANQKNAMVLGTGDLSELALGWCTYGVGDHMSHYNVNASVPKTLIQHLIRWVSRTQTLGAEASAVLHDILHTEITPELVPGSDDKPVQRTEDFVGPYSLQDFNLYYLSRFGLRPSKVAFLAWHAWRDANEGAWPPGVEDNRRCAYDLATIHRWLDVFLHRFFTTSQFKRTAVPNGPKISSGGSLSPRGDWRMPSDASAEVFRQELARAFQKLSEK
ncbi:MAG: NAD(+) synthase, partial [Arenibacterium sp.]